MGLGEKPDPQWADIVEKISKFPMSAASIGREEQAIDFLLVNAPKNRYLVNGHNYQDVRWGNLNKYVE
ncbi:MAG: hypothetical protein MUF36_04585 [Bacteroidales bacterium]|jgi:hypothetical protein|nr:hypothetical protein [Bacteroidales bacterium]